MQLTHNLTLPPTYGKVVEEYEKTLEVGKYYDAHTLNEEFRIIPCKGIIQNNNHYHPHFKIDSSENELFIRHIASAQIEKKWWTLDFAEAVKYRRLNIAAWQEKLKTELAKHE